MEESEHTYDDLTAEEAIALIYFDEKKKGKFP